MNTMVYPFHIEDIETVATTRQMANQTSATVTTTLYDLVAAIQTAIKPGEEDLVVPLVVRILDAGRVTLPSV